MATAALAPPLPQQQYSKEDEMLLVFARLMEGGREDDETCRDLDSLTALLNSDSDASSAPGHESICKAIDMDLVDTLLGYLDLRQPDAIRGRAVLTTSAYLRAAGAQGEQQLTEFFGNRIRRSAYDDYIVAFCVAAATFPIVPALTSRLFLADGFLSSLGPLMRRKWKSRKVETACLEMLNAACMMPECRDAVDKYCTDWLEEVVDSDPAEVVAEISRETDVQQQGGTISLRRHSEHVLNMAAVILMKLRVSGLGGRRPSYRPVF
jgi:hypothetical protein